MELFIVGIIVIGAIFFSARGAIKNLKGEGGCSCGGGCSCASDSPSKKDKC